MTARVPVTQPSRRGRRTWSEEQICESRWVTASATKRDGTGPLWRAFLLPFAVLPGKCRGRQRTSRPSGPAVFMLLCRRLLLLDPLRGVGAGARGGGARGGRELRGNNGALGGPGLAWGLGAVGPPARPSHLPLICHHISACRSSRVYHVHVKGRGGEMKRWSGGRESGWQVLKHWQRWGLRSLGGPPRPGYYPRGGVTRSLLLPSVHRDCVLFLRGFFVVKSWVSATRKKAGVAFSSGLRGKACALAWAGGVHCQAWAASVVSAYFP